jgi:2-polyprenyl-3-methyl-5-hydroxy-6-metoxy-1,4-benzoquinol methylase
MTGDKLNYFINSALRYNSKKQCPSCGSKNYDLSDQKYLVTRLLKCADCNLLYRHPTDSAEFNFKFYQKQYTQDDGITTNLPNKAEIQSMIQNNFPGKNVDMYIGMFQTLFKGKVNNQIKVVDYGCSWGYQSYQFLKAGFECVPYEISRHRADFGNTELNLSIITDEKDIPLENDIFFSSHVIEHVPSPHTMIQVGLDKLKKGGFFIAESPNGSDSFREKYPDWFHRFWGRVHPNYLSDAFYAKALKDHPFLITSSPFETVLDQVGAWDQNSQQILDVSGPELLVIAKK